MAGATKKVTDETFETEVLHSDKPVLVDFWAEWCGPCKVVAPVLDEIAREKSEQLSVVKLNIDENPRTAMAYQVMSIPTMTLFKKGEIVASIVGVRPKAALLREIENHLS